jgi:hypothetical protein
MKHLSRVLSLALVIALSLGLVVTAGAAVTEYENYTDIEALSPQYTEATDVLTALGVFQGNEDNSLNPQGTFTRAQAAKIATYISIGATASERLSPRVSKFADVSTSHWANKYVEYGVENGIINGVSADRFNPEGPVTGAQLAKMLLVAIGYGAKGEYIGASWELNAIVDGQTHGILTVDANYSDPAKREEAIQYVFNTIAPGPKNHLVKLNSLINDYVYANQDSVLTTGTAQHLGKEVFGLRKDSTFLNEYGYTAHKWYQGPVAITGKYRDGVVLATNTSGLAITGPIGLTTITSPFYRVDLDDAIPVTYWRNGTQIVATAGTPGGDGLVNPLEENSKLYTSWTEYNAVTTKIENAAVTAYVMDYNRDTNVPADGPDEDEDRAALAAWNAVINAGGTLAAAEVIRASINDANHNFTTSAALRQAIIDALDDEYDDDPGVLYRDDVIFGHAITDPVPPLSAIEQANVFAAKRGVIVEFVDNNFNNKADKVILIDKSVRTVAAAPSVSAAGMVSIPGVTPRALPGTEIIYPSGLATGDIVLHHDTTEDGITVTHIDKAESVRGQMTSYNNNLITINFGGATYTISGLTGNFRQVAGFDNHREFVHPESGNYNLDATGYFDDDGSLVQIVLDAPAPQNYVILLGIAGGIGGYNFSYTIQAKALLTDGTVKVINISKVDGVLAENQNQFDLGLDTAEHVIAGVNAALDGPIFSYVIDANGNYELTRQVDRDTEPDPPYTVSNVAFTAATVRNQILFLSQNAGNTVLAARANDNTKFIVGVGAGATRTYKVYQGVRSAPKFAADDSVSGWYINDRSGFAAVVYLDGTLDSATSAVNYVYFVNPNSFTSTTPPVGSSYIGVQAIVDGAVKNVNLSRGAFLTVQGAMLEANPENMADNWFLWVATYDDTGTIDTVSHANNGALGVLQADLDSHKGTTPGAWGVVTVDTPFGEYLYDNSTKIFYITMGPGGVEFDSVTADQYF